MITIRFNDRDIDHSGDAKSARAMLRKHGLSIRNGTKESPTLWVFNRNAPVTVPKTNPLLREVMGDREPKVKATVDIEVKTLEITQAEVDAATLIVQRQLDKIGNLPVLGADLQPYDSLMNFVPDKHLTIDHRGVTHIVHEPENITRTRNEYLGFYSLESGGTSSYKIDPKRLYDVRRD